MTRRAWTSVLCVIALMTVASVSARQEVPHRVYDTASAQDTTFDAMVLALSKADVVFVGEQHDDPNTHRLERMVLEGVGRVRGDIILTLEMFERDVQPLVDRFHRGAIPESEFLKASRPWPRYATDYKPLVDLAIERKWPIVAANIPRPIASEISKGGLEVLANKSEVELEVIAHDWDCPVDDEYYRRFKEVMGSHTGAAELDKYYAAQCLKDETMAESIAKAWSAAAKAKPGVRPLAVHYNGSFHSDYGLGTVSRLKRRLPEAKVVVVTMVPVASLDTVTTGDHVKKGDFIVFTSK